MELANLKGTEKQVNWAKTIRKDRLKVWQGADPDCFQEVEHLLGALDVASWWITSKDKSLQQVASQLSGGARPKAAPMKASPAASLQRASRMVDEEVWDLVTTATGFRRAGLTRDQLTGAVVHDATLPF
jgi:hypothetical protein